MIQVGIGTRVLNFIVDVLLITALSFAVFKAWQFYAYYYHILFFPFYYFFWCIWVLYYFVFESIFGRTPGKWLSVSKVVSKKGGRPNILQYMVRSVSRLILIDAFFIPFLDKTLHDYVSATEVVEA